jgi:hypothetical protein
MFLKSIEVFIPEPLMVRHPVPYGPELRRDEAIAAFSTMPLLGHEGCLAIRAAFSFGGGHLRRRISFR